MQGKYSQVTIKPTISHLFNAASGGVDVLFDWQAIEIPNGACVIKSISGTIMGLNGSTGNRVDMRLYYAKSIDGVAPATFGTVHATHTAAITQPFRRNIIGHSYIDSSTVDDGESLAGYNVWGARGEENLEHVNMVLTADSVPYPETTPGYQTIFVAAKANGAAFDFGTDVDLDMAGHQAASTAAVQITTSGTDPRNVFQPGDLIQGETGTVTAEVVSVDSATTMTVKDVSAQIDNNEKIQHKNPITLNFGLEY